MEFSPISYTKLPKASALSLDYLYRLERVAQFYNGSPFDSARYQTLARELRYTASERAALVQILTQQNKSLGSGEKTLANIKRLTEPGACAVVTGQQVGLFSGPAFTLYKV